MQDVIKEVISFAEVGSSDQDKENDRADGPPTPTQGPAHQPAAHAPSTASFKSTPSRHVQTPMPPSMSPLASAGPAMDLLIALLPNFALAACMLRFCSP